MGGRFGWSAASDWFTGARSAARVCGNADVGVWVLWGYIYMWGGLVMLHLWVIWQGGGSLSLRAVLYG